MDPRSARLNTELGVLFVNAELGAMLGEFWDRVIHEGSYRLTLQQQHDDIFDSVEDRLVWIESTEQGEVRHGHEPLTGAWRRLLTNIMGLLPVEDQL